MLYNQTNQWNGIPMPLLMGFTPPEQIQEVENEVPIMYDPISQTVIVYDMRVVGTKCLKTSTTKYKSSTSNNSTKQDKKNEIDDTKNA